MEYTLNLGAWAERSIVNGPGERFVIWLQGCSLQCKGCINKEFWSREPHLMINVNDLALQILRTKDIQGVTFSGGEPTEQVAGLLALSRILREHDLDIVMYSGYTVEQLQNRSDPQLTELLKLVDLLIDGPYIEDQAAPLLWRGSQNQVVHWQNNRLLNANELFDTKPKQQVELIIGQNGWTMTGNWKNQFERRLQQVLDELGTQVD